MPLGPTEQALPGQDQAQHGSQAQHDSQAQHGSQARRAARGGWQNQEVGGPPDDGGDDDSYGVVDRPSGGNIQRARLIGALSLVLVAVLTTVLSASWLWSNAQAVSPVDVPAGTAGDVKTISPSIRPSPTPTPEGRVIGGLFYNGVDDTMPMMSSAWTSQGDSTGLNGGAAGVMTVHKDYDGKEDWINYVAFGSLGKGIVFTNTPAGLKSATIKATETALVRLYDPNVKLIGKATHRPLTVDGHAGHELTIKVDVRKPKLPETFSTVMVAVVDRGDGTAVVSVADIAGSTPQWLPVWRTKVSQIQFSN
ncbi:hypothetical protein [Kribbella italica]|uniref:Uncharacterized protein n=1 Tax=Kribbella italica TaxID=1540520 RepID=A0A7W9MS00_9ACTN|nr:hypothetical protein [Kribbella italica]MBB5834196.1 hypothetical protein [Kribbella italica]